SREKAAARANTPAPASVITRDRSVRVIMPLRALGERGLSLALDPLVLERVLVPHALFADPAGEDRRVVGEHFRAEMRVVNVPDDDDQEGHQPFLAVREIGRRYHLARQDA